MDGPFASCSSLEESNKDLQKLPILKRIRMWNGYALSCGGQNAHRPWSSLPSPVLQSLMRDGHYVHFLTYMATESVKIFQCIRNTLPIMPVMKWRVTATIVIDAAIKTAHGRDGRWTKTSCSSPSKENHTFLFHLNRLILKTRHHNWTGCSSFNQYIENDFRRWELFYYVKFRF